MLNLLNQMKEYNSFYNYNQYYPNINYNNPNDYTKLQNMNSQSLENYYF